MINYIFYITYIFFCFFIGAIPTGFIIGKLKNIDIRDKGSKNIGATNVTRTLGPVFGLITLSVDSLKAFLPLFLFKTIMNYFKLEVPILTFDFWLALASVFVLFGNIFNPFLNFKGGKGVATGLGIMLYLNPIGVIIVFFVFIIVFILFKYISLGSIFAVISIVAFSFFKIKSPYILISIFLIGTFVIIRHKENIKRLINRSENRFSLKKKE